jgi:hypothetical protein
MDTENSGDLITPSETTAIGERGFLIRGIGDQIWFRVYATGDETHAFVDYEITHHDCEIVIIDASAALIRNAAGDFLDYTSESMTIVK